MISARIVLSAAKQFPVISPILQMTQNADVILMGTRYDAPAGKHKSADASKTSSVLLISFREQQVRHLNTQKTGAAILVVALAFLPLIGNAADLEKKDRHARDEVERLQKSLSTDISESERLKVQRQVDEIRSAIENNHRPTIPNYVDLAAFPILVVDALHNPVGIGRTPASNIHPSDSNDDLSRL